MSSLKNLDIFLPFFVEHPVKSLLLLFDRDVRPGMLSA